jgi:hypothetical protein
MAGATVSMNQSIDYPSKCKFGFHSVLANTLSTSGMIQGLRSTSLSNRLHTKQTVRVLFDVGGTCLHLAKISFPSGIVFVLYSAPPKLRKAMFHTLVGFDTRTHAVMRRCGVMWMCRDLSCSVPAAVKVAAGGD